MSLYSSALPPKPPAEVPIARAWEPAEWPKVCVLRSQFDAAISMASPKQLDRETVEALQDIGPKIPCFAIAPGGYIILDTSWGTKVLPIPTDIEQRMLLYSDLDHACPTHVPPLPQGDGTFELIASCWKQNWAFRNHEPSALVMDRALLEQEAFWMIVEGHERAHAIGFNDQQAIAVETVVAQILHETGRYAESQSLLEECNRRLSGQF